jgi:hypothetical protein
MLEQRTIRKKGERHYKGHEPGDLVWLEGTNLRLSHPTAKLAPKRYGPFKITKKISPVVFQLELPGHWTIHNVFHASLLTPYRETQEHGINYPEPSPELIEESEEYEVDRIMNSRCHGRKKKLQFLIHWKGYSTAHDSWEDATDVFAPQKVEEYYQRKRTAIRTLDYKSSDDSPSNDHSKVPVDLAFLSDNQSLIYCLSISMSYGTPGIFFDGTTSVSGIEPAQQQGAEPAHHDYFGR